PVEVAVLETGMGGRWDATNIADAQISVITPIGIDHTEYLGEGRRSIATEKAGIIKPGGIAVLAEQPADAERALLERAVEVDATVARAGSEFGVLNRDIAVGGQLLSLQGLGGVYDEIFLPLHGRHQADNAALALAAVEAFFGAGKERQLEVEVVREAFAAVQTPGRLERVKASPPVLSEVGATQTSSPRAVAADELATLALPIFGEERVTVEPRLDSAIDAAVTLVEQTDDPEEPLSGGGVLVTGSVVTAGEARTLF